MVKSEMIPYSPEIPARISIRDGPWGVIIAHGERSYIDKGILPALSKKLSEKNISNILFNFPFRIEERKYDKDTFSIDETFKAVYKWVTEKYPEKQWILGGHDIGAESTVRIAPIVSDFGELPPIICLSYPLYPPNRPDQVDMRPLGAIIGEALFCQGTESNRGNHTRIRNSIRMMAEHVHVSPIKGANHQLEIKGKDFDRVAYWISNDFERFISKL